MEIWKDIVNFEGHYQISNFGSVRSVDRYVGYKNGGKRLIKGQLINLEPNANGNGYTIVRLFKDKKRYKPYVHRLVAEHFIPNPDNKPEVNHKDTNKTNNHVDNLEWNTRIENQQHAMRNGRFVQSEKRNRKAVENIVKYPVDMFDLEGNLIETFPSKNDAARFIGTTKYLFNSKYLDKDKSYNGFVFKGKTKKIED